MIAICQWSRRCRWVQTIRRHETYKRMLILGCCAATFAAMPQVARPRAAVPPGSCLNLVTRHQIASVPLPERTLIRLSTWQPGGTGWLDAQVEQAAVPTTGNMSMLTNWYLAIKSGLRHGFAADWCNAVHRLGQTCVRSAATSGPTRRCPTVVVSSGHRCQALLLTLYPFQCLSQHHDQAISPSGQCAIRRPINWSGLSEKRRAYSVFAFDT